MDNNRATVLTIYTQKTNPLTFTSTVYYIPLVDTDDDGIPDEIDPFPEDRGRGTD